MKNPLFSENPAAHALACLAMFCATALTSPLTFAQGVSVSAQTATASGTVVQNVQLAVQDAPFGLAEGLVRELRNGGYVLYLRHGALLPGPADVVGRGEWWKDCQNTQGIGVETQAQMRAINEAFTRQRIAVYELLTSEFCRAFDTASLLGFAPPQRTAALNDVSVLRSNPQTTANLATFTDGIQQLIVKPTPAKTNRVLVGHALPPHLIHPVLATLPEGHTAIFKVDPGSRFHHITTLSPGQWQSVGKASVPDTVAIPQIPPQVTVSAPPPPNIPLIDPTKELKGAALVEALRKGGLNLYMRHAMSNIGQDGGLNTTPMWWENCAIQRNIADMGKEQARKVGLAISELKIPISQVLTAQFCRTRDTGHAMNLGPLEVTEDLNHQIGQRVGFDINAARYKQLAETPPKGSNRLLVSHTHGSPKMEERIMGSIQEAEIVVYKPDGKGAAEPIARIPPAEWENLVKATAPAAK